MRDTRVPFSLVSIQRSSAQTDLDFDQVFSRNVDPVYRFLYSRVGNREDAEALTSEVFLKAARELDHSCTEARLEQWLFTVARAVLTEHWRRYYRSGAIVALNNGGMGELPEELDGPSASVAGELLVEQVLKDSPDHYRRVIELRFQKGHSIQEAAQEMGETLENVRAIEHRILAEALRVAEEPT